MKTHWLACCLMLLLPWAAMNAQVTKADYTRSDSILNLEKHVYHSAVRPHWLGESHYFWYQSREKSGMVFYLVDAQSGKKQQAKDKESLAQYLKDEALKEELLRERKPFNWWEARREPAKPVASPDSLWEAYIQDNNLHVRSRKDPKQDVALTMDGIRNYYYSDRMIMWSPDSTRRRLPRCVSAMSKNVGFRSWSRILPRKSSPSSSGATMQNRAMSFLPPSLSSLIGKTRSRFLWIHSSMKTSSAYT